MRLIEDDQELQQLANGYLAHEVADHVIELDVSDCDDLIGEHFAGFTKCFELLQKAKPGQDLYKLTFSDYGDDDGIMIFLGTRSEVIDRIRQAPIPDEDNEDLDDE